MIYWNYNYIRLVTVFQAASLAAVVFIFACNNKKKRSSETENNNPNETLISGEQPDLNNGNASNIRPFVQSSTDNPQTDPSSLIQSTLQCDNLSGGAWIRVPGDLIYGTRDFCVQKYIASNVGGVPTSKNGLSPWVNINQIDARSACSAMGTGYHLVTNPEWMTIAVNIANNDDNLSGGIVGVGELARGHSDNSPPQACAADSVDANAWVESNCSGVTQGSFAFNNRRTQYLSNESLIWDLAGNLYQWVDTNDRNNKPGRAINGWVEYTTLGAGTASWPRSAFLPTNAAQSWWNDNWNSLQSIGQIYPASNSSGGALIRGGQWSDTHLAGIFSTNLSYDSSYAHSGIGFRCSYSPETYTIIYESNGATSGSVPLDGKKYVVTQPVVILDNSGSLAKSGLVFSGWNNAPDGSGTTYHPGSILPISPSEDKMLRLYALWSVNSNFSITYHGNTNTAGIEPTDLSPYHYGDVATVLANSGNLEKSGYTFVGWNTDSDGSGVTYLPGQFLNILSSDVNLYAKWAIVSGSIAYTTYGTYSFVVSETYLRSRMTITINGASGGCIFGGTGGEVTYEFSPTEVGNLEILVGQGGTCTGMGPQLATFGGGGASGAGGTAGAGGGRSQVSFNDGNLTAILAVAGGGGGGTGNWSCTAGGHGGGTTAANGSSVDISSCGGALGTGGATGGGGGNNTTGGSAGTGRFSTATAGVAFTGGRGSDDCQTHNFSNGTPAGGGGGGWYGGGGGGFDCSNGGYYGGTGGGGGSSYVNQSYSGFISSQNIQGTTPTSRILKGNDGSVTIRWDPL